MQLDEMLTATQFHKDIEVLARPVLFRRGAIDWPARTKWTPDYLAKIIGKDDVKTSMIPYGDLDGVAEKTLSVKEFFAGMFESGKTNLTGPPPPYLFDRDIMGKSHTKQLGGDMFLPSAFADLHIRSVQLIVGPEGSGSPVHFHTGAFNAVLFGRKRWFLHPPSTAYWANKPALPWLMDGDAHGVGVDQPLECMQHPGDVLYVPPQWGHAVINVEDVVAVAMEMDSDAEFNGVET
jgi:histone arginine demethylase JMJD6